MEENITYKQDYPINTALQNNPTFHFQVQPPRFVQNGIPQNFGTQVTQPVAQVQQPQPQTLGRLWLLIEWDMPPGGPNTYAVIDSAEMFCPNTNLPTRDNIHTGKAILVKRGKRNLPATIVIISGESFKIPFSTFYHFYLYGKIY